MYTPDMTKSSPHFYRQTLEKLAEEPPTTKTALLHALLPQIQVALRSGKTLKQVWQRLSEDGLDISCETFCRLVRRARAKTHASARHAKREKSGGVRREYSRDREQCRP